MIIIGKCILENTFEICYYMSRGSSCAHPPTFLSFHNGAWREQEQERDRFPPGWSESGNSGTLKVRTSEWLWGVREEGGRRWRSTAGTRGSPAPAIGACSKTGEKDIPRDMACGCVTEKLERSNKIFREIFFSNFL